jgi:signal transduction histidine kinase
MSMRDRARDIGAQWELRSTPGQGTTVTLIIYFAQRKTGFLS